MLWSSNLQTLLAELRTKKFIKKKKKKATYLVATACPVIGSTAAIWTTVIKSAVVTIATTGPIIVGASTRAVAPWK